MSKKESNELAVVEDSQFAIMKMGEGAVAELLAENLGQDGLSVQDLTRIKVPSGGGTSWTIPSIEGDRLSKELVGVIVFTQTTRTYWIESFDDTGGGAPPDCYSPDGVVGVGIMADQVKDKLCANCQMSQFADDGSGCPCKEGRLIFMIMKDEILPTVIKAPVMSLKGAKKYLTGLTSRIQKVHSVYTRLTLAVDRNKRGIEFSKIIFEKLGDVENPAITAKYAADLRPFIDQASATIVSEPQN